MQNSDSSFATRSLSKNRRLVRIVIYHLPYGLFPISHNFNCTGFRRNYWVENINRNDLNIIDTSLFLAHCDDYEGCLNTCCKLHKSCWMCEFLFMFFADQLEGKFQRKCTVTVGSNYIHKKCATWREWAGGGVLVYQWDDSCAASELLE